LIEVRFRPRFRAVQEDLLTFACTPLETCARGLIP